MQRADPDPVAAQDQRPRLAVPEGHGELAPGLREHPFAEILVKMHPELGVAAGGRGCGRAQKLLLELGILEDLAVLGDPDRAVLIAQRLTASRQVHDREPPRPQGQARLDVDMLVVRSAMGDRAGHRQEPRCGKLALTSQIDCAGNATHGLRLSRRRGSLPGNAESAASHPAPQ